METCDDMLRNHTDGREGIRFLRKAVLSHKGNPGESHQRLSVAGREANPARLFQENLERENAPITSHQRARARVASAEDLKQTSSRRIGDRLGLMRACSTLCAALVIGISLFPAPLHAQFVYAANTGSNDVSAYTIDPRTGALTPIAGSPFPAGSAPVSVAVDPSGKFAYVANFNSSTVSAYTIDPRTGALTPIAGSPFPVGSESLFAGSEPLSVAVDPSGRFTYVTNSTGGVSGFMIDSSTGALTAIAGSPFPSGLFPASVAVDPSGKFAYVADQFSAPNNISAYAIDPSTGVLSPVAGSPFPAQPGFPEPVSVAVVPSGRFAYVVNTGSFTVSAFTIEPSTGALTAVAGSPVRTGFVPAAVAVHPSGKFAYVANEGSGDDVSAYTIDPRTGALTAIAGSPFPAPADSIPISVAVDPSGKFAYVANFNGASVSVYAIDPRTGALTTIAGSPFPAGSAPHSVTITGGH